MKKFKLDEIDYLLLHYVKEFGIKINDLLRDDLDIAINMPHHHLISNKVIEKINLLKKNNFIYIINDANHYIVEDNWEQIINGRYFLTNKGGKIWEDYFNPNWQNYTDSSEELISENLSLLCIKTANFDLYEELCDFFVEKTIFIELLAWQATYWKKLPKGFVFSYLGDEINEIYKIMEKYSDWERSFWP